MFQDFVETRCYANPSKICHLYRLAEQNTEEESRLLCFTFARHYGVDAGCTVCGQIKAHNAHWKRIKSSASGLFKQEFGGDQSASGRSHVAASLCSKVTVVAKTLLISAPEVSHPVVLLRRFSMRQLQTQTISEGAAQTWECITSSMQFPPSII